MKAAVVYQPGGPDKLTLEDRPIPQPNPNEILIEVKAFGLNRSELFTRQGHSPDVSFPQILGREVVGIVAQSPSGRFNQGDRVMTAMGPMGRHTPGSYAQYTCVPENQVRRLPETTSLSWAQLAALPEMLQAAWNSLFRALRLERGDRLLIRGGTTSIGLAAASIAKMHGVYVVSTTRRDSRVELLRRCGADEIIIDDGAVANHIRSQEVEPFTKVLELLGTSTLKDSLECVADYGIVCMAGMVGGEWTISQCSPMEIIPPTVCLTAYSGSVRDFMRMPMDELIDQIEKKALIIPTLRTFALEDIVQAHQCMENNEAEGKIVVTV